MTQSILKIKNLHAEVEGLEILKGVDLEIKTGELHVIMGPNGTGKSTLASVIMGHPRYEITEGEITLDGEDVLEMEVDERARAGLFLAMQYPSEVPGVTNSDFIRTAIQARTEKPVNLYRFIKDLDQALETLNFPEEIAHRYLNDGFSGGEKKRNEVLQLLMLKPKFAIMDEIDSGLDVDALRVVGAAVNSLRGENFGGLLITHYQRILDYIKPDIVHVMMQGRIVKTGGMELMERIDRDGYEWIKEELGIEDERVVANDKKEERPTMIGTCATREALDL